MEDGSENESGSEYLPSSTSEGTKDESGSEQLLPSSTSEGTKDESGSEQSLPSSTSEGTKNESGSEHSLPSSTSQGTNSSDSKEKKKNSTEPCDVCGEDVLGYLMMTCFRCNYTRRHIHCTSFSNGAVDADVWTCDHCNVSAARVADDSTESDTSRNNQMQDSIDQAASSSRTNQAHVDNEVVQQKTTSDSCHEISATNPPSQTHPRPVVEEASPPKKKQKKSDKDAHSDSESAK